MVQSGHTGRESLSRICYFAVGEGLDHLLLEWLAQPLASTEAQAIQALDPHSGDLHRWRGAVLRSIIQGHLLLEVMLVLMKRSRFSSIPWPVSNWHVSTIRKTVT